MHPLNSTQGVMICAILLGVVDALNAATAGGDLQRMEGKDIANRLAGMEFTDEVHWAFAFSGDGALLIKSMGRKATGRWRIEKDALCLDRPTNRPTATPTGEWHCYEVWVSSGHQVQLRATEAAGVYDEGVLRKTPTP